MLGRGRRDLGCRACVSGCRAFVPIEHGALSAFRICQVPSLLRALDDTDVGVRSAAVKGLGYLDPGALTKHTPALLQRLSHPEPGVRAARLCYAMLCHAMPCYGMPCYGVPCHGVPCYAMLPRGRRARGRGQGRRAAVGAAWAPGEHRPLRAAPHRRIDATRRCIDAPRWVRPTGRLVAQVTREAAQGAIFELMGDKDGEVRAAVPAARVELAICSCLVRCVLRGRA